MNLEISGFYWKLHQMWGLHNHQNDDRKGLYKSQNVPENVTEKSYLQNANFQELSRAFEEQFLDWGILSHLKRA